MHDVLLPVFRHDLSEIIGQEATIYIDASDSQTINFEYPHIFTTESILEYDNKYFDIYIKDGLSTKFNNAILGDATVELGPFYNFMDGDGYYRNHNSWYNSISLNIQSYVSWFHRGGSYDETVNAGQFRFSHYTGEAQIYRGFRFVLAF